jgi:hypothetical protein
MCWGVKRNVTERYIRVAAVVIAASEGIKNICFREFREALLIVQKRRHQIEASNIFSAESNINTLY